MKRTLIALVAALALASSAGAASLSLTPSGTSFNAGDTVTLTLEAVIDGNETENLAGGFIELIVTQGSATFVDNVVQSPLVALVETVVPSVGTFIVPTDFTLQPTPCPNPNNRCTVVNQNQNNIANPSPLQAGTFLLATVDYILDTDGIVEFAGSMQPDNTFFGADIPGVSSGEITVSVPEPAIAGLLALGLGGLAIVGRRR